MNLILEAQHAHRSGWNNLAPKQWKGQRVYIGGGWWADGDQVCHLTAAAAATTPTDTHTGKGTGEGTKEGEKVDGKKTQKQDKATRLPRLDCDT